MTGETDALKRVALSLALWHVPWTGDDWEDIKRWQAAGEVILDGLLEQGWKRVKQMDHDEAYRKAKSRWDKFWNRHQGKERFELLRWFERSLPRGLILGGEEPLNLYKTTWLFTRPGWLEHYALPAIDETPPRRP